MVIAWCAFAIKLLNPVIRITGYISLLQKRFMVLARKDSKFAIARTGIRITTNPTICVTERDHKIFLMQWNMEPIFRLAKPTVRKVMSTMKKIPTFSLMDDGIARHAGVHQKNAQDNANLISSDGVKRGILQPVIRIS